MIRVTLCTTALVTVASTAAFAQAKAPSKAPAPAAVTIPAGAVGTWEGKSMIGPKDSVVATFTVTFAADGKSTLQFPNRPLVTARLIAAGGDSVVTEAGPYESVVKKGLTTTTRTTGHYKGDAMSGTFSAKYSDGSTLSGKTMGTRKKAPPPPAKKP